MRRPGENMLPNEKRTLGVIEEVLHQRAGRGEPVSESSAIL